MITAPIKGDISFEGSEGFPDIPKFPADVAYPEVHWTLVDGTPELLVTLTVGDRIGNYRFMGNGRGGIVPEPGTSESEDSRLLWARLDPNVAGAINDWANAAHERLEAAVATLTDAAAPQGSEAYAAIIAFATDDDVIPWYAKTAKERTLERANDALKPYVTFADDELERPGRFRDLLADLRHAADEQGVDFDEVLENSYRSYQEDLASQGFATDLL